MQIRLREKVQSVNHACDAKATLLYAKVRLQLRRRLRIGSKKLVDVAGAGRPGAGGEKKV